MNRIRQSTLLIRPEITKDYEAIAAVEQQACGLKEANLVEALRSHHKIILSLLASSSIHPNLVASKCL